MEIFVPGRLAILGEHTDWICSYRDRNPFLDIGLCLVCATNEGIYARVSRGETGAGGADKEKSVFIFEHHDDTGEVRCFESTYDRRALEQQARDEQSFFSYVAGAVASVLESYYSDGERELSSLKISNYKTTLPMGRGLSSSAAISVLVVRAFNESFDLGMTLSEIMAIAYKGERKTASECGMMDFCVVMGQDTAALMVMAEEGYCELNVIKNKEPLHFVVADLRADPPKNTVEILSSLNNCFPLPRGSGEVLMGQLHMHDYAHDSATLCLNSVDAIEKGDTNLLANMMTSAQASFDAGAMLVCPSQLKSPYLHRAIDKLSEVPGALAVKGVGSQGDGSVQILCEDAAAQARVMERLSQSDIGAEGFYLTLSTRSEKRGGEREAEEGGASSGSLTQSRVPIAVLVVKRGQGHRREEEMMRSFGLNAVRAAEACLLSCGVQRVCTVFEHDEAASTLDAAGASGSGTEEEKKEKMEGTDEERRLAYGRYLLKGRLHAQCTRVHAAASGHTELHATVLNSIEGVAGKVHPAASDTTKILLCSSQQENFHREVLHTLLKHQQQRTVPGGNSDERARTTRIVTLSELRMESALDI